MLQPQQISVLFPLERVLCQEPKVWVVPYPVLCLVLAAFGPALEAKYTLPFKAKLCHEKPKGKHFPGIQGTFFYPLSLK